MTLRSNASRRGMSKSRPTSRQPPESPPAGSDTSRESEGGASPGARLDPGEGDASRARSAAHPDGEAIGPGGRGDGPAPRTSAPGGEASRSAWRACPPAASSSGTAASPVSRGGPGRRRSRRRVSQARWSSAAEPSGEGKDSSRSRWSHGVTSRRSCSRWAAVRSRADELRAAWVRPRDRAAARLEAVTQRRAVETRVGGEDPSERGRSPPARAAIAHMISSRRQSSRRGGTISPVGNHAAGDGGPRPANAEREGDVEGRPGVKGNERAAMLSAAARTAAAHRPARAMGRPIVAMPAAVMSAAAGSAGARRAGGGAEEPEREERDEKPEHERRVRPAPEAEAAPRGRGPSSGGRGPSRRGPTDGGRAPPWRPHQEHAPRPRVENVPGRRREDGRPRGRREQP